ncbi:MAG TPA: glycosyltransferase family 4 protein, partial [Kiritimatiellia bacterium]|nr:glycosyltransferase family 4 protein [Kiritimatiellia bacterium]
MNLRVAHLHANPGWGGGETQLLALVRRMQARGLFAVLATPAGGELARRARQAGVRVLEWTETASSRRQLALDLEEFGLTLLHAHDSGSTSLGHWLKRRLRVPLILTRRIASPLRRNPLSRWKYSPRRLDGVIAIS